MELKMFDFIEEVNGCLRDIRSELKEIAEEIENYLEECLIPVNEGNLHIRSRVKSSSSLREKILRNSYYKNYKTGEELILNLHDLIGVRIECRFIEDEKEIYNALREYFVVKDEESGYYYNPKNENILLELDSIQPQRQKNGFEIFRIDGLYKNGDKCYNYELQIKSLVNVFWGEIEHKIIYKNNNYMIADGFLKEIMKSIKKNLSMIDNQLLLIYNQYNYSNAIDPLVRKNHIEVLLSKMIYDIFSTKMKDSIGFIVDFKKSCDTIVNYIFRTNHAHDLEGYNKTLLKMFDRINEISKDEVNFNSEIKFERDVCVNGEFARVISKEILNNINNDFQWNLFFKILFEIELGNNAEDFECFIKYLCNEFYGSHSFVELYKKFEIEEAEEIKEDLMVSIAKAYEKNGTINFIQEKYIEDINESLDNYLKVLCEVVKDFEQWAENKETYLEIFTVKVLLILNTNIERKVINKIIKKIKSVNKDEDNKKKLLEFFN